MQWVSLLKGICSCNVIPQKSTDGLGKTLRGQLVQIQFKQNLNTTTFICSMILILNFTVALYFGNVCEVPPSPPHTLWLKKTQVSYVKISH